MNACRLSVHCRFCDRRMIPELWKHRSATGVGPVGKGLWKSPDKAACHSPLWGWSTAGHRNLHCVLSLDVASCTIPASEGIFDFNECLKYKASQWGSQLPLALLSCSLCCRALRLIQGIRQGLPCSSWFMWESSNKILRFVNLVSNNKYTLSRGQGAH